MALSPQEMKQRLLHLFDEANKGNLNVFDTMLTTDFISYGGAGLQDLYGKAAFKELYITFLNTFPDLQFRILDTIAEGKMCAARALLQGTHLGNFMGMANPTGKKISWNGLAVFSFNDEGLMDKRWQEWDGVSFMQQVGVIPATPETATPSVAPLQPPTIANPRRPSPEENKTILRRFIEEIWNRGNLEVADELFHPAAITPDAPLPPGPAGIKTIASMFLQAFPDLVMTIEDVIAEDDKVVGRFTETATHKGDFMGIAPTGKQVKFTELAILRIANGQIIESWFQFDSLGLLNQLGLGVAAGG